VPIYEYECQTCHHRVELIQKVSDAPLAECPKCKGAVKKIIAPPALQFRGSGWYITDYSDKGKPKTDAAPAAEKKPADTKPAGEAAASSSSTPVEKKSAPPSKPDGSGAT
jgi:putative FmdB family regulatory protein